MSANDVSKLCRMAKGTGRLGNFIFAYNKRLTTEERISGTLRDVNNKGYRWDNSTHMKIMIQGMKLWARQGH
ncbi:MAG: hypothetical protein MJE68_10880 [Proteobacteria bacterium]|nr:hypothetical protein [Pseudomonadota bacterium]